MEGEPQQLIETVAEAVAYTILRQHPRVETAVVRVDKPEAPIDGAFGTVGAWYAHCAWFFKDCIVSSPSRTDEQRPHCDSMLKVLICGMQRWRSPEVVILSTRRSSTRITDQVAIFGIWSEPVPFFLCTWIGIKVHMHFHSSCNVFGSQN